MPYPAMGSYPADHGNFITFPSRRSVVHGTKGIVSTVSPLANEAALRILREGGNAADAAVAAAAVLNVVDPAMTGIGGDAFALYFNAATKKVTALNGSGRSAAAATLDGVCRDLEIEDRFYGSIPTTSAHAVTVPGSAAAWVDLIDKFGSGAVTLGQVLAPAIELAEEGFVVSEIASYCWILMEDELRRKPNGTDLLTKDPTAEHGYRAPRPSERMTNKLLAKTFRMLAAEGKKGFYEGPVAKAIVDIVKDLGGSLELADLARHGQEGSELTEAVPLRLSSNILSTRSPESDESLDFWEHPPNGQGIVAQIALGIMQQLEEQGKVPGFAAAEHNSARYLHLIIETLRIAFADGSWFVTDPDVAVDPSSLLSAEYLAERARLFNPDKTTHLVSHGSPVHKTSDTIYLAVTDAAGNACSFVSSVAENFGSRIVPAGTGFVLQSRGSGFNLHPDHPNVFAPGKRPYNTIIPALVTNTRDGSLNTVLGVMGGAVQPQGHVQVLLNMLVFGMNPQVALDAPRICIGINLPGKSTDPSKQVDNTVYLEEGIREDVIKELENMGHEIKLLTEMKRGMFGRGQVIRAYRDPKDGGLVYSAGSDMRGDGAAAPFV